MPIEATQSLRDLVEAVFYRIHLALIDNGVQFRSRKRDICDSRHIFDRVCAEHGIEHRLTKVDHPWTNGQVERINRTIRDAVVKRDGHDSRERLAAHLQPFVDAYDHARRPKTLRGLTPAEFIHRTWTREPDRFTLDPSRRTPGPCTWTNVQSGRSSCGVGGRSRQGGLRQGSPTWLFPVALIGFGPWFPARR